MFFKSKYRNSHDNVCFIFSYQPFLFCFSFVVVLVVPVAGGARRYLFYTFGVLKSSPYPLFFLRYSLFAVLYPTGIAGEVMTMVAALPDLKV